MTYEQRIENLACAGEERFGLQRLSLTKFADGNSINTEYYFVLSLKTIYAFVNQRSWMATTILVPEAWLLRSEQPCIAARNIITGSEPCFIFRLRTLWTSLPWYYLISVSKTSHSLPSFSL